MFIVVLINRAIFSCAFRCRSESCRRKLRRKRRQESRRNSRRERGFAGGCFHPYKIRSASCSEKKIAIVFHFIIYCYLQLRVFLYKSQPFKTKVNKKS